MKFGIGQMFENRAYRAFSKARARLAPQLRALEEALLPVGTAGEQVDDILVTFVDPPQGHYRELKNRDRIYHVEVAIPDQESYPPAEDEALLLKIAEKLREVLERAPVKDATRAELLQRFSEWEGAVRQQSLRPV